ncbi:MAG: hypothetical protein K2N21_00160, partial [Rikenellaceae bacterium]|nr:hypothetical protein [Rikenellaceae bacterium]
QPAVLHNWSRLEAIIKWAGLTTHSFAVHIGLNRSENLYQIKRGRNGISSDLANRIIEFFPEIDYNWIMTGEGYMLNQTPVCYENCSKGIPFFQGELTDILCNFENHTPQSYIKIPIICDCDLCATMTGDAMSPEIEPGSLLMIKNIDPEYISYGERYITITERNTLVRYIRPAEDSTDQLSLIPVNTDKYDTLTIKRKSVKRLFLIRGVITVRV